MLDFQEEVLQFKVRGKQYEVSKPTNGDIKNYKKALAKCKNEVEQEKCLKEFLHNLGLEDDGVLDILTPKQSKKLIASLYDTEKN